MLGQGGSEVKTCRACSRLPDVVELPVQDAHGARLRVRPQRTPAPDGCLVAQPLLQLRVEHGSVVSMAGARTRDCAHHAPHADMHISTGEGVSCCVWDVPKCTEDAAPA